jgi:phosphate transport system substrate-binding protein
MKILALPLAATLVLGACSSDDGDDTGGGSGDGSSLSGNVEVDGSSTVGPLAEYAADLFMESNPDVRVAVATSGTGGGFEKFCKGETDFNDASRPIKDEEIALCEENGIAYEGVQVANDALAVVVNPDNPVDCMTVEQVNQIWDEGSTVSTWGDVDGLDIGDFASETITLYGPGTDSGTFDYFTEEINGEEGKIRDDYTSIGEDDQAAITAVEGDVAAMAFIPYSFFQEAGDLVKPLAIDDGNGCVEPTLENVQDGSYTPLGRPLFSYASDAALAKPQAVAFITFWIENSDEIAEGAGFVPMTQEQKDASLAQVESLQG